MPGHIESLGLVSFCFWDHPQPKQTNVISGAGSPICFLAVAGPLHGATA
jgi:hypothetical protein